MRNALYALMTMMVIGCFACGDAVYTGEPGENHDELAVDEGPVAYGAFGGYLRDIPEFSTTSEDVVVRDTTWESHIDVFGTALNDEGDEWVVMSRVRFPNGDSVWDLSPGAYQYTDEDIVLGVACAGNVRDNWLFDSTARETSVVISDNDDYRVIEYEHYFLDSSGNEGYISGFTNLPRE